MCLVILLITKLGFPIRKSPDQRLLDTYPRLIAATPRPSSPQSPEASTICPYNLPTWLAINNHDFIQEEIYLFEYAPLRRGSIVKVRSNICFQSKTAFKKRVSEI